MIYNRTNAVWLWATCLLLVPVALAQKATVGVTQIDAAAQSISCSGWDAYTGNDCNADLAEGFRVMLETAIFKTGKMDLFERSRMDAVEEQLLAEGGLTDAGGKVGSLTGVDYLMYGAVTKFGSATQGTSVNTSRFGRFGRKAGGVNSGKATVEMGVDIRITDVETGKILIADSVEGSVQAGSAFSVGGVSSAKGSADPFADVQRVVAAMIAEKIVTYRYPIKIISKQGDGTLIVNYGSIMLKPDDILVAFALGEAFVDPDTGETLGAEETELGSVTVTQADARFSKARVASGDPAAFAVGTILKRGTTTSSPDDGKRKRSGAKL